LESEYVWAAAIVAVPCAALAVVELISVLRKRRSKALAQRSKGAPRG
jgi:heme exporter protein D